MPAFFKDPKRTLAADAVNTGRSSDGTLIQLSARNIVKLANEQPLKLIASESLGFAATAR